MENLLDFWEFNFCSKDAIKSFAHYDLGVVEQDWSFEKLWNEKVSYFSFPLKFPNALGLYLRLFETVPVVFTFVN